ncbi:MAG: type II secretion system secretin GspD [Solimonas sp.]
MLPGAAALLLALPGGAAAQDGPAAPVVDAAVVKETARQTMKEAGAGKATLNLRDADISTLIATVSEVTGRNFIVDPRVKGKVTVVSASPMDARAIYATFLSVLEVSGYAAIPAGASVKIVPDANAKTEAGALTGSGDDMVTRVLDVRRGSATQLVALLRPLVAQSGHLAAYGNSLIVSDRAANVTRIERLVAQMQQNGDTAVEMVKLEHAVAEEVVKTLSGLAQQAKQGDAAGTQTQVLADVRTNSVLISGDRDEREALVDLVHRLDQPGGDGGDTQVVFLHYADAESLAPLLMGYAQQQASKSSGSSGSGGSGLMASGGSGAKPSASSSAAGGGAAPSSASSSSGATASSKGDLSVLSDKDTNSLVITAPPKIMQQVRSVIAQLDIRRAQVLVEAIVAEVTGDNSSDIGVDWVAYNPDSIAAVGITNSSTSSALSSIATAITGGSTSSEALYGAAATALGSGGSMLIGTTTSNGSIYGALIKALTSNARTNILSTPSLVTLDNQEAKIQVGQSVPELTGSYASTSSTSTVNPFQTIDRTDIGLKLGITPTIGEGNTIRLKLDFENSTIASGTAGSSDLITNKRTVSNMVCIEGGQILVIGGLIDDQVTDSVTAIPLLSDIPVLGNLFKSRSVSHQKRNLMIFIRPVILRSRDEGNYYTRRKYTDVQQAQRDASNGTARQIGGPSPVLEPYVESALPGAVPADTAN